LENRCKKRENAAFQIKNSSFSAKNRIFPVIFGGQISPCGIFCAEKFSTGVDFKTLTNNLQDFFGNLYPPGV
jgi:hypothetical protein